MAATPDGRRLTEAHRSEQAAIRARVAADTAAAWRLLNLADLDASTPGWLAVMLALIGVHRADSAQAAARYYREHRAAELADQPGEHPPAADVRPERHAVPNRPAATTSLLVTGPSAIKAATSRGVPPEQASATALARVTGAAARHALAGGRAVLREAVAADPAALGWIRVTDADPCGFCAMLASRGPVYKTRDAAQWADGTAGQAFHDGCACTVEPVYDLSAPWPGRAAEFAALWADATAGLSGAEARNAFRRAVETRRASGGTTPEQPEQRPAEVPPAASDVPADGDQRPADGPDLAALSDDELAEVFAAESARDEPDFDLIERIGDEMDRREAEQPDSDPLDGVDLSRLPDHDLFDLWRQHDRSVSAVERITAELDRRDRAAADRSDEPDPDTVGDDPDAVDFLAELDAELAAERAQRDAAEAAEAAERARQAEIDARIDTLIARGWDYAEAYAEVYQLDPEELRRQELAAAVDTQRRTGETRDQAVRRLYDEWVYLQWIAAEKATNGYLLNAAGIAAGIDPRELWGGNVERARKYASEELKRWWQEHPRKTLTEFRADMLGRDRDRQAAARAVGRGNDRDFGI